MTLLHISRLLLLFSIVLYALGFLVGASLQPEIGMLMSMFGMFGMMIMAVVCLAVQLGLVFGKRRDRHG